MARARNIKPGFYKNEALAECSVWARLIFPGLWMLADREGRLEDRPKRIKGELLPFDPKDVDPLLDELQAQNFILRYQNEEGRFIQILKFNQHQSPHYSEKTSIIKPPVIQESTGHDAPPKPENPQAIKRGPQPPDSLNPDSLNPSSLIPESEPAPQEDRGEARATRLPPHWRPGKACTEFSQAEHPQWTAERLERAIADFRDHWISKGERRADWDAAWRKWIRSERDPQNVPQAAQAPIPAAQSTEKANQALLEARQARESASPMPDHIRALLRAPKPAA